MPLLLACDGNNCYLITTIRLAEFVTNPVNYVSLISLKQINFILAEMSFPNFEALMLRVHQR